MMRSAAEKLFLGDAFERLDELLLEVKSNGSVADEAKAVQIQRWLCVFARERYRAKSAGTRPVVGNSPKKRFRRA